MSRQNGRGDRGEPKKSRHHQPLVGDDEMGGVPPGLVAMWRSALERHRMGWTRDQQLAYHRAQEAAHCNTPSTSRTGSRVGHTDHRRRAQHTSTGRDTERVHNLYAYEHDDGHGQWVLVGYVPEYHPSVEVLWRPAYRWFPIGFTVPLVQPPVDLSPRTVMERTPSAGAAGRWFVVGYVPSYHAKQGVEWFPANRWFPNDVEPPLVQPPLPPPSPVASPDISPDISSAIVEYYYPTEEDETIQRGRVRERSPAAYFMAGMCQKTPCQTQTTRHQPDSDFRSSETSTRH